MQKLSMRKIKLKYKIAILMMVIVAISLVLNVVWTVNNQRELAEQEMREKAQVLSLQLDSIWEFMAINQSLINHDESGNYDFKGLHCSIVGKSVGSIFSEKTDYITRYVKENPRNPIDAADPFEQAKLRQFESDKTLKEAWEITDYNGQTVFRYMRPMYIDSSCLECHGDSRGEIDVTGYAKEGMKLGDLGGAMSIIMPTDIYFANIMRNTIGGIAFFALLMIVAIIIVYMAMSKLVTKPLNKLEKAVGQIERGDLNVELGQLDAQGEIADLAEHFETMTAQLRDLYSGLENKVEMRTQELAQANNILKDQREQLEAANGRLLEDNQYKSDFLAIMSHELRTPLTSVIAFTEILQTNQTPRNEEEKRILDEIKNNGYLLLGLINNILEMARIEAGKQELYIDAVDMFDVINSVESVIEPLALAKNINFTTDIALDIPMMAGDADKIRRIVENLVGNAIKFTQEGGRVTVQVGCQTTAQTAKQEIIIQVSDNGIGIRQEDTPYIFEKFMQSDTSVSRRYNGSGLGLALTKELVEMHHGWIKLESRVGEGSIFTVGLPVAFDKGVGASE